LLINTGRRGLADEVALSAALERGHLGGVGLDILHREEAGANPFTDLPNVLIMPHTAGGSRDAVSRALLMSTDNIRRVLAGEPPLHLIPGSAVLVQWTPQCERPWNSGLRFSAKARWPSLWSSLSKQALTSFHPHECRTERPSR
jgi:hypothetical protein